jgi:hypothetical protein
MAENVTTKKRLLPDISREEAASTARPAVGSAENDAHLSGS